MESEHGRLLHDMTDHLCKKFSFVHSGSLGSRVLVDEPNFEWGTADGSPKRGVEGQLEVGRDTNSGKSSLNSSGKMEGRMCLLGMRDGFAEG